MQVLELARRRHSSFDFLKAKRSLQVPLYLSPVVGGHNENFNSAGRAKQKTHRQKSRRLPKLDGVEGAYTPSRLLATT
jgi:hypothetical protein